MKKTYWKNVFREVRSSFSRFAAIMAIVALGVGFLAGLLSTTPDMRRSVDQMYDDTDMMDLHILSTLGLNDNDVDAIRKTDGVFSVMPIYRQDAVMTAAGGDSLAARIQSLPEDAEQSTDGGYQNRITITEGRMPQAENECVVEMMTALQNVTVQLGDVLTISDENKDATKNDTFSVKSFTVVGLAESAFYFSIEKETTDIASGAIHYILYTPEASFKLPVYTDAFVLLEDAKTYSCFTDEYLDFCDDAVTVMKQTADRRAAARYNEIVAEAEQKLNEAQKEYDDKKAAVQQQLEEAQQQIADGRNEYQSGRDALTDARLQMAQGQVELLTAKLSYERIRAQAQEQLDRAQAQVDVAQAALDAAAQQLQSAGSTVAFVTEIMSGIENGSWEDLVPDDKKKQFDEWFAKLEAAYPLVAQTLKTMFQPVWDSIDNLDASTRARIAGYLHSQFDGKTAEYNAGVDAYNSGLAQLEAARAQLADGQAQLAAGEQQAQEQFAAAEQKISDAAAIITANGGQLTGAAASLSEAEQQLKDAKTEAGVQLDDGQKQLDEARTKLKDIKEPVWYVLTRETNAGYVSYEGNTEKVESIAKVFPLFFFLVAALVALTTMTRMVDEQRMQIGTMKALGYHKSRILLKYLLYAGMATILGSIIGLVVGLWVFPTVIYGAYGIMYSLPPLILGIDWLMSLLIVLAALVCTLLATLWAGYSSLWECPARLMLPRAPKIGKRILLEYITPIWSRMSFTYKVTARNLFRYKKRLLMTVLGIAGCTALLLTGFGLQDAIHDIVDLQFGQLWHYNLMLTTDGVNEPLREALNDRSLYSDYEAMYQKSCTVVHQAGREEQKATMVVGESMERMAEFMTLRDRVSQQPITLTENAVVITEKMADQLGVRAGDSVLVSNDIGQEAMLTVSGVAENYVYSYVYLSKSLFESAYGDMPQANDVAVMLADNSAEGRARAGEQLLNIECVSAISFTQDILDTFSNMMKSINYIVYVLIISAGALAFVVLYNLTNINITERQKEIATIKVLGFRRREVGMYIFREIILLSLLGTLVGLVLGIFLTRFVVLTAEVDLVMFGRTIKWQSYLIAAALTMAFSGLVDLVMYRRLNRIDMVESLKAGE